MHHITENSVSKCENNCYLYGLIELSKRKVWEMWGQVVICSELFPHPLPFRAIILYGQKLSTSSSITLRT